MKKSKAKTSPPAALSPATSPTVSSSLAWASVWSRLPSQPGVYWFTDATGKLLYVGKAKNLKKRVASYKRLQNLPERIRLLSTTAQKLKFQVLASELEALLVEAELIQTHQPEFNILLKDNKSKLYLLITKDKFPRLQTLRKRELVLSNPKGKIVGPFPSNYKLKEVLKIVRYIFPWCDKPELRDKNRACFYYHLGQCPGVCTHEISAQDYQDIIRHLVMFLRGQKKDVIKDLKDQMQFFSKQNQFEQAQVLRDRINLIEEVTDPRYKLKPDLSLPILRSSIEEEQLVQLSRLLRDHLQLPAQFIPHRIEGYDVSNTQGLNAAVAMVTFTDGQADKANYRLFNIKTIKQANDYAMLQEALARRQRHPEWGRPDLVLIDGGKGQVRAALSVWEWHSPVIGLVKHPDRVVIPLVNKQTVVTGKRKKIDYKIIKLTEDNLVLQLLQQIRDESHRFSKKQHHRRSTKSLLS